MAPKSEKKRHLVTTCVGDATIRRIEEIMDREGRPRADVVRRLVEAQLQDQAKKAAREKV